MFIHYITTFRGLFAFHSLRYRKVYPNTLFFFSLARLLLSNEYVVIFSRYPYLDYARSWARTSSTIPCLVDDVSLLAIDSGDNLQHGRTSPTISTSLSLAYWYPHIAHTRAVITFQMLCSIIFLQFVTLQIEELLTCVDSSDWLCAQFIHSLPFSSLKIV